MDERELRPAFDLATERRRREIEALPFEPRMHVERILFTAQADKERADIDRARSIERQREGFRQQVLTGTLAPLLRPAWAPQRRPSREEVDRMTQHAVEQYAKAAKLRDDARIDGRAAQRVDAMLALYRGLEETPEQRVAAMQKALAAQSRRLGRQGREYGRER